MPKTKKENKIEINSKGKELDEIVNAIIIKCNDTIVKWKKEVEEEGRRCNESHIDAWDIQIDNIPVKLSLECVVQGFRPINTSPKYNDYKLYIATGLDWGGNIHLDEETSNFNHFSHSVKVEKDVIDRNDITRHIIDLFNVDDLRYCKLQNLFVKKDDIYSKVGNYFNFKYINLEECCVCYDKTIVRTKMCKHYLCLECVSKMKSIKGRPRGCLNYINCPMCKAEVNEMTIRAVNCDSDSD